VRSPSAQFRTTNQRLFAANTFAPPASLPLIIYRTEFHDGQTPVHVADLVFYFASHLFFPRFVFPK